MIARRLSAEEWRELPKGYYWQKSYHTHDRWEICLVDDGYVHFVGAASQWLGNGAEWLVKCVEVGDMIARPTEVEST